MQSETLTITYEGEELIIEIIAEEHDLQYKLNFEHPVYIKKDMDEQGIDYWLEVGAGKTLRASEIGREIESHPDFL